MIEGYYYLHVNKELIYKPGSDSIIDIRESDFCESAWAFQSKDRGVAWGMLVEALSLGAKRERVFELAEKWGINDEDAAAYASHINISLGVDGSALTAYKKDFQDLQQSPCGFGDTYLEAMADLCKQLGYKGGKMWNKQFVELCNPSGGK